MNKRAVAMACAILLALCSILAAPCNAVTAKANQNENEMLTWEKPEMEGDGDILVGTSGLTYNFWYNDNMLLKDAEAEYTDLIKMGVVLSSLAYERDKIENAYKVMGFSCVQGNYDREATYEDNDFVGVNIGCKESGDNKIFIIAVRGTPNSAEWFSDFNLGSGNTHLGFSKAAGEIEDFLNGYFAQNATATGRNTIFITGHSRGAAVANILAEYIPRAYSQFFSKSDVFGYNFACPAVSRNADKTLKNIHNYNIPGDSVPAMPLSAWGFKRNGQDHLLNASGDSYANFLYQFNNMNGEEYAGPANTELFTLTLKRIAPTQQDYINEEVVFYTLAALLASNGKDMLSAAGTFADYERKVLNDKGTLLYTGKVALDNVLGVLTGDSGLFGTIEGVTSGDALINYGFETRIRYVGNVRDDASAAAAQYAEAKLNYALEHNGQVLSFESWARNRDDIGAAARLAEMSITTLDDLHQAIEVLDGIKNALLSAKPTMDDVYSLLFSVYVSPVPGVISSVSAARAFLTGVGHAHDYPNYTKWVNSQYYGAAGWTGYKGHLDCVSIPSTITRLGSWCFERCAGLEEVIIPDSVVNIGVQTFRDCSALADVTVPVDLAASGDAFFGDLNLVSVHFTYGQTGIMDDSINSTNSGAKKVFTWGMQSLTKVSFSDEVTYIGNQAFKDCKGLKNATLPANLKEIGEQAFYGCNSLEAIEIPEGCTKLGNNCFLNCSDMLYAGLPDSLEELGKSCFAGCSKMQIESVLPASLKSIGECCFANCKVLTEQLILPDGIESIGYNAFIYTPVVELTFPTQVARSDWSERYYEGDVQISTPRIRKLTITKGTDGVLKGICDSVSKISYLTQFPELEELTLDEGIVALEDAALAQTGIASIHFPSTLTKIGDYAFYKCTNDGFEIPYATMIGKYAFSDCQNVVSIRLAENLKSIGSNAFARCKALKNVYLGNELEAISESAFSGCMALEEIIVPDTVTDIGERAFMYCRALNSVTLGKGLKKIGDSAFYECEKLKKGIVIPDGAEEIGSYAFYKCPLESVTLGNGLTKIGERAFYDGGPYDGIRIPQSVTDIGNMAFGYGYRRHQNFTVYGYKDTAAQAYASKNGFGFVELQPEPEIVYKNLYRLYNPNSGEHFYTGSEDERDHLASLGWNYEGIACQTPETSDVPVYRLYNPNAGDHHYTTSEEERDNLVTVGWNYEGIAWYSDHADGTPVYRLYNPNEMGAGAHHYTASEEERDYLVSLGWHFEGVSWFGK